MITLPPDTDLYHLKRIHDLGLKLMARHGLPLTGRRAWTLRFDGATVRAGCCRRHLRQISLSARLMALWPVEEATDTILHEIAHALTDGHHNAAWKAMARKIGARPEACYDAANLPQVPARYIGHCPKGHVHYRRRMTKDMDRRACGWCSRTWNIANLITWTVNGSLPG